MIDKLKWYLISIAMNKYLPMGGMAVITALGTYLAAHSGMLEQYGVTYGLWPLSWPVGQEPSGPVVLIELDTLRVATITALAGLITVALRAAQHHTTGTDVKPAAAPPEGMV